MITDNDIKSKNPFKVPEDYFEEVTRRIIHAASETGIPQSKKIIPFRTRNFISVAASLAVLLAIGILAVKLVLQSPDTRKVPRISLQEFSDIYLYEINITDLEKDSEITAFSEDIPEVRSNEIIDYLMLENIKEYDIYEFFNTEMQ